MHDMISWELILIVIVTIIAAAVSTRNRLWGVAIVLALLPTYVIRSSMFGIPVTLLEGLVLGVVVGTVCSHDGRAAVALVLRQRWVWVLCGVYIVAGVFGVVVAPFHTPALGLFKTYIVEPVLFFVVVVSTLRRERDLVVLWWALGLTAVATAGVALVQYATGWGIPDPWNVLPDRRATAWYGFPNAVGLFIAPILAVWIGQLIHRPMSPRLRILIGLACAVMASALLSARVDGALVAVAVATLVLFFFHRFRWAAVGCAFVGLTTLLLYAPTRAILTFQDVSGDVRLALWRGTWTMLRHQPIFGAGLGNFPFVYDIYRLPSHVELLQYSHNIALDFWSELGLLGLAWIVLTLIAAVRMIVLRRATVPHLLPVLGAVVVVVVYGIVDVPIFKNDLVLLFWTWLAMIFSAPVREPSSSPNA